jgi:predicted esterase
MRTALLALHGFTMNGAGLRHMLAPLAARLGTAVQIDCPDAPNAASTESVDRLAPLLGGVRAQPPHWQWWNASEDGQEYLGWAESLGVLRARAETLQQTLRANGEQEGRLGVFGYSQGAAVAAALAALAERGEFPRLAFVVLVAGFLPRARAIAPLFEPRLTCPSLHVVGEQDPFGKHALPLRDAFQDSELLHWGGGHQLPTGAAADPLVEFITRHTTQSVAPALVSA